MLRDPTFVLPFSICILFDWDSSLCSLSSSSRMPTTRGSSTGGAPGADWAQEVIEDHGPQDSSDEVAHGDGAPTLDTTTVAGAMAFEAVVGDGSLSPEVGEVAIGIPAVSTGPSVCSSSPQPQMGAATTSTVVDDDIVEEPEVILGHPLLRAPWDVSLDEAVGMARWVLDQAQNKLRWECGDIYDERQCLLLWASMLKELSISEMARENVR
jgi:hypothetical protein